MKKDEDKDLDEDASVKTWTYVIVGIVVFAVVALLVFLLCLATKVRQANSAQSIGQGTRKAGKNKDNYK